MVIELINTGSELLLGRVLNTHQQWLCRKLADMGYVVSRQVAVPDTGLDIQQAVRESLSRADLIITTGGLGPTSDDITRDLVAQMLGTQLVEDTSVLANIQSFFDIRKRAMPDSTRVQALVPEGAIVLANAHGTAPGLAMKLQPNPFRDAAQPTWLIMLPGPPRELRPMFNDMVVPLLRRELPMSNSFVCSTIRTTGLGESLVEKRLIEPLGQLVKSGLVIGYCARPGQVDVRLVASGGDSQNLVSAAEKLVQESIGKYIYAAGDEEIETTIVRLLTEKHGTLAMAESCTGGCIANHITNVPGASAILLGGLVTYSNEAKQKLLDVKAETLAQHGAVSEPVAREMAEGARKKLGSRYALSVTGIAGPSGGTPEKPVGTVFIGLATPEKTMVEKYFNPYDRETFKEVTTHQALELLRRSLLS